MACVFQHVQSKAEHSGRSARVRAVITAIIACNGFEALLWCCVCV